MEEVTIGDKIYVSAKRAAEITGYARDYVGQLCREGHVDAKMVGRSWYVYEPSIRAHRFGEGSVEAQTPKIKPQSAPEEVEQKKEDSASVSEEEAETSVNQVGSWQKPIYTVEEPEMLPPITPAPESSSLTDMQSAWQEWFDTRQTALKSGISDAPELETPEIIDARAEEYVREHDTEPDVVVEEVDEHSEEATIEEQDEENTEENEGETAVPLHIIEDTHKEKDQNEHSGETKYSSNQADEEEQVLIRRVRAAPPPSYAHVEPVRLVPPRQVQRTPQYIPVAATPTHEMEGRVVEERIIRRAGATRTKRRSNAPVIALLIGICLISVTVATIGSGIASKYLQTTVGNNPVIEFLVGTRQYSR